MLFRSPTESAGPATFGNSPTLFDTPSRPSQGTCDVSEISSWWLTSTFGTVRRASGARNGGNGEVETRYDGMTTTIHDTTTDQRALRYGGLILMVLLWLSGCAGQTGSGTPATAMLAPSAPPVLLADASAKPAVASDAAEKPSDDLFDPFAKSGEEGVEEYDPWESLNTKVFEIGRAHV